MAVNFPIDGHGRGRYNVAVNGENLVIYGEYDVSHSTSVCTSGPRAYPPTGCLVHTTSGDNSRQWLQGGSCAAGSPAGADYLIERNGQRYRLQPDGRYAYHAGKSQVHLERLYVNDEVSQVLLGIELECLDIQWPTYMQYDSLAELIIGRAPVYGWRWPFIIYGHYAVARPQGRRSDPVNFDWGALQGRLYLRAKMAGIPGM